MIKVSLNLPCIIRKVLRHVEIHRHMVTVVRVAPNPFTLHHLSSPSITWRCSHFNKMHFEVAFTLRDVVCSGDAMTGRLK